VTPESRAELTDSQIEKVVKAFQDLAGPWLEAMKDLTRHSNPVVRSAAREAFQRHDTSAAREARKRLSKES